MINKIIRNFIAKQMAGRSDDGIMITLKDPQRVTLGENILADTLMRYGIDPAAITSEAQLKSILQQIKNAQAAEIREAGIRNTTSAKVFDLKGKRIKDTDNIMGGEEMPPPGSRGGPDDIAAPVQSSEETLKNMIMAENKKNINKIKQRQKMLDDAIDNQSPQLTGDRKYDADIVAADLAERMGLVYDDMPTKERLKLYDEAYTGLSKRRQMQRQSLEDFVDDAGGVDESDPRGIDDFIPEPEDKAKGGRAGFSEGNGVADEEAENAKFAKRVRELMDEGFDMGEAVREAMKEGYANGGRIGFKKGMDRRTFMKIMGGIGAAGAAAKTGLLKLMGKEKAAPVVEKAAEVLGGGTPPPYFFNLVKKIKNLGDDVTNLLATNERQKVTKYKDYELTEDLVTGEQTIQRIKMSDHQYYDENLAEEVYMNYKPGKGQTDEATGAKVADEYTEDTGYLRTSGPQKGDLYDSESGVPKDVIEEGTVFEDNVTDFETKEKTKKIKKAEGGRIPFVFGGGIFKAVIQNLAKEKGVSPSEYLRIANYKSLPDSVKRFMSEAEFLKLKETMTGKRIEMVENVRDMIQSRLAFDKSKADLAASMNKASPGYGDAAVKMMFPEGSFKSPVPAGAGEKDVMMMEQLIKNLQTKGRKENASGGLAGMLGE